MFGKPQWFRPKTIGWGLTPVTWQGWAYTATWVAAIACPFLLLISRHQPIEAMAWVGLGIGALAYDVRQVLRAMRSPATAANPREDNVLYILDDEQAHGRVATRSFNLQMK